MNKFNIGDLVEVKSWEQMVKEFGIDKMGDIPLQGFFTKEMKPLCGKRAIITDIYRHNVILKDMNEENIYICFNFTEDMLNLVEKEEEFKTGDYVLVKDWLDLKIEHKLDSDGGINVNPPFVVEMKRFCGKLFKIYEVSKDSCKLVSFNNEKINSWKFSKKCLIKITDENIKQVLNLNMVVEYENGKRRMLIKEDTLIGFDGYSVLSIYKKDLTAKFKEMNIKKIFTLKNNAPTMECLFKDENLKQIWERETETETEIDWLNIKIDTKILVSSDKITWHKRYFDKIVDGKIYAFNNGLTSFTVGSIKNTTYWEYAKLA